MCSILSDLHRAVLNLAFSKLDPYNININSLIGIREPGHVAQSVASLTADPGIVSLIPALFHTFVDIYHGHSPPSADSKKVVVSYKRKYVHEVLLNRLVKVSKGAKIRNRYNQVPHLTQEKVWLGDLTVST